MGTKICGINVPLKNLVLETSIPKLVPSEVPSSPLYNNDDNFICKLSDADETKICSSFTSLKSLFLERTLFTLQTSNNAK